MRIAPRVANCDIRPIGDHLLPLHALFVKRDSGAKPLHAASPPCQAPSHCEPSDARTCRQVLMAAERAISRLRRGLLSPLALAHLPRRQTVAIEGWLQRGVPTHSMESRHGARPIDAPRAYAPPPLGQVSASSAATPGAPAIDHRTSHTRVTNLGTLLDVLA